MKVRIEKDLCLGDASCAEICPEVFEVRGDGLAYVKENADYEGCGDKLKDAVEGCPVDAIIIEE
jgi:ferredoxin